MLCCASAAQLRFALCLLTSVQRRRCLNGDGSTRRLDTTTLSSTFRRTTFRAVCHLAHRRLFWLFFGSSGLGRGLALATVTCLSGAYFTATQSPPSLLHFTCRTLTSSIAGIAGYVRCFSLSLTSLTALGRLSIWALCGGIKCGTCKLAETSLLLLKKISATLLLPR